MAEETHIREAREDDATQLVTLAERAFRDAFGADNAPSDMDAYVGETFTLERVRSELADEASTYLLAFIGDDDAPVGYAKLRAGVTDPCVTGPEPIELERIYADQSVIGRGVGAALMQAVLDTARAGGHLTLWLGVWERNARAIAFYERWQFVEVGSHPFLLGSDEQTDLVMQRAVSAEREMQ